LPGTFDSTSPRNARNAGMSITRIPQVQECHMVAGGFDYLVKVRVPDMPAFRAFLGEVLSKVPGIRETHTYAVMERVKESTALDLSHLRAAASAAERA
jgi:Lrp/AsnC family leucine-responsive transcriptional regulator